MSKRDDRSESTASGKQPPAALPDPGEGSGGSERTVIDRDVLAELRAYQEAQARAKAEEAAAAAAPEPDALPPSENTGIRLMRVDRELDALLDEPTPAAVAPAPAPASDPDDAASRDAAADLLGSAPDDATSDDHEGDDHERDDHERDDHERDDHEAHDHESQDLASDDHASDHDANAASASADDWGESPAASPADAPEPSDADPASAAPTDDPTADPASSGAASATADDWGDSPNAEPGADSPAAPDDWASDSQSSLDDAFPNNPDAAAQLGDAFPSDEDAPSTDPSIGDLGPAFPDDEPAEDLQSGPTEAIQELEWDAPLSDQELGPAPEPKSTDMPTSAKPRLDVGAMADDAPSLTPAEEPLHQEPGPPVEDAWAALDDGASNAWRSVTGESKVERRRQSPEDGLVRQKTNVFAAGEEVRSEQGARLVCTSGEDEGREFAIIGRDVVIGRSPSCTIVLTETSVSREHARIVREGDAHLLYDKKSGNGTFVNGERVKKAKLTSGDEVAFGKAKFRFLELGDVFKPVDDAGAAVLPSSSGQSHRALFVSGIILVVTLLAATAILLYRAQKNHEKQDSAFGFFLTGVDAYKNRQWSKAEQQFTILLTLDPENDKAQQYLQMVARERTYEVQIQGARQSWSRGDLPQAYTQSAAIIDSVYTQEAREILKGIDAELDARMARAKTALEARHPREAMELLGAVEAIRPGRPEVAALLDRASKVLAETGGKGEREPSRGATIPMGGDHPPPNPVVDKAVQQFMGGDIAGAEQLAAAAPDNRDAQILVAKIQKFTQVYDSAQAEYKAKRTETAIRLLNEAKSFEAKITGGRGNVAGEINKKLADMYYVEGIEGYLAQRWGDAYQGFAAAVAIEPNHQASQKKLDELAQRAIAAFAQGESLKDRDHEAARSQYRLVLQTVPPSNDYYRRAKQRLDALP